MYEGQFPIHSKPLWREPDWFDGEGDLVRCFYHSVGSCIGLHQNDFFELDIVVAGRGLHRLNAQNVEVMPGYVCVIPPQVEHGYINDADLNIFHLLLRNAFFERYALELRDLPGFSMLFEISSFIANRSANAFSFRLDEAGFSEIISDMDVLIALERDKYAGRFIHAAARAICLIATLSARLYDTNRSILYTQNASMQVIIKSLETIREHSCDDISIDELVRASNMSRSSYVRLFRQLVDCTPHEFLLRCRVANARRLLSHTDMPLSEVAQECGFFDSSHFTRIFSRFESVTPSAYRRLHAGHASYASCMLCAPGADTLRAIDG